MPQTDPVLLFAAPDLFRKWSGAMSYFPLVLSAPLVFSLLLFSASTVRAESKERELLGETCYELLHSDDIVDQADQEACLQKLRKGALPHLVITPTRRPENLRSVPAAVSIITQEQLSRRSIDGLAEALRDVPGVEISDSGQPGLKRIRVRGEDSRRVAILVDGQEFFDPRDAGTPLLLAPETIERIEVVRGTGSVLHGARAIGGVVNFITKKGGYHPLQGSASTSYDSATKGAQQYASLFGSKDDFDYRLSGTIADHDNRNTPDGEIDNTAFENNSWSAYLAKAFGKHRIAASYEDYNSSAEVYVDPAVSKAPPFLDFRIDVPERDRNKAALFYDGEELGEVLTSVHFDAYYQESEREFNTFSTTSMLIAETPVVSDTEILTSSQNETVGANGQLAVQAATDHRVIIGVEVTNDELDQTRERSVRRAALPASLETVFDAADQLSVEPFIQDEWAVHPDWLLTAGIRGYFIDSGLDQSSRPGLRAESVSDEHAVAAVGVKYIAFEDTTLWGSWSQGYVFPSLNQLATGAFAGADFVNPNLELDAETADTFELGSRFDNKLVAAEVALFHTSAEDYINHSLCSAVFADCIVPTGARDRVYVNIDEARTFGVEVAARLRGDSITPYATVTWLRRRFEDATSTTYNTGIPEVFGRAGVELFKDLSSTADFWIDLYLRGAGEAEERNSRGNIEHTAGWVTSNIAFVSSLGSKRQYQLSLELRNLGDKRYYSATESVLAAERSAVIKLSAHF